MKIALNFIFLLFKIVNKETTSKNIFKYNSNDLNHLLEDLSPFYSEKSIDDMGLIEILSRTKK